MDYESLFGLRGQVALVTGAGAGIGRAIAELLSCAGASVVVSDLSPDAAEKVARNIQQSQGEAIGVGCDVTEEGDRQAAVQTAVDRFSSRSTSTMPAAAARNPSICPPGFAGAPGQEISPPPADADRDGTEGSASSPREQNAASTPCSRLNPGGRAEMASPGELELRQRLRLYEAVLSAGPIFVHVYDRAMNSRWSTAMLRPELGYQPGHLMSAEENYAFVHPEDRPSQRLDDPARSEGEPSSLPRRIRVRDAQGEWRWLAILSVNLLDDPTVGSVVVHCWDVTEEVTREEELDAARQRLAALIDTLEEAVVVVNDGTITFANGRVTELFPMAEPHDELIGRPAHDVQEAFAQATVDPPAFVGTTRRMIAAGEAVRGRFVETINGRILEQHFVPIRVGDRETSRVWVYRDVTAQLQLKRRQERLLRLGRTARRSAEHQNERLRELAELDELKTAFIAKVSHELRTPLSALTSYLELLLDPDGDPLTDEQRTIAPAVQRGADRLARLADDLLVREQLQSRSLRIDDVPVDVAAAVLEALDDVQSAGSAGPEIRADAEAGPPVRGDRVRLSQIVSNLLNNTVKFADRVVRCSARADDGSWLVEVTDDGPGIPEDELSPVFEPFFRGRGPSTTQRPGTGARTPDQCALAELLARSLEVENCSTGGTRARLVLPIDEPLPSTAGS